MLQPDDQAALDICERLGLASPPSSCTPFQVDWYDITSTPSPKPTMNTSAAFVIAASVLISAATATEPLRVISWNVESGGSDPAIIAKQLAELGRNDVFALQEVHPRDADRYGQAIRTVYGKQYRYLVSHTGRNDRLLLAFDSARLALESITELFQHGGHRLNDWKHRSPLVATFRDTKSNQRFALVTVHLARGNAGLRTEQARGLAKWAVDVRLPVIAIGDFNMDFDFHTQRGNEAFQVFLAAPVLQWVQPATRVDTNWADAMVTARTTIPTPCLTSHGSQAQPSSGPLKRSSWFEKETFPTTPKPATIGQ